MSETLCPFGARLIVRRDEPAGKSRGGIILPDIAKEKMTTGKILSVGDVQNKSLLKEGATVLFRHYAGNDINFNDEELLAICEDDIQAVLI
jgi:chaperonin GroES